MVTPFALAFVLSYLLKKPIGALSEKLQINWRLASILTVLIFFGTIGILTVF